MVVHARRAHFWRAKKWKKMKLYVHYIVYIRILYNLYITAYAVVEVGAVVVHARGVDLDRYIERERGREREKEREGEYI